MKEVVNGCEKLTHQPGLLEIYRDLGYIVKDCPAECGKGKDYNENLQYYRQYEPDKIKGYFRTQCPKVE